MNIIVAGDGKVGLAITRLLSQEGHDIVAIDTKSQVLEESLQRLDVMSVSGNCATMETLREANVEQSDILIAATSADETNLLCCLTARKMNPSLHTIARVRTPEYTEQLYMMREDFGLSLIINPEREAAQEIHRLLQFPGFLKRETFDSAIKNLTPYKNEARGLGFQVKGNGYFPGGELLSEGSFGHTGFTGTSLYVDNETQLWGILLTNAVHFGRDNRDEYFSVRRAFYDMIITEYRAMTTEDKI